MIRQRQRGISLLSLLIGTAIGIFLVGATLNVYIDSKQAFKTRNVVAEVSENQRFALDDMRRILVMTGRELTGGDDNNANRRAFPPLATTGSAASAAPNAGAEFILDGGNTGSDIIAIRFRRGPSCGAYQNVPDNVRPSMVRFLLADTDGDGNTDDLVCELRTYGSGLACSNSPYCRQTLASNIRLLKVLYGVDDDDDGYANRYLTAPQVENLTNPDGSNTPWARVVTLRVALVAGSDEELPANMRKGSVDTLSVLGMNFNEPDTSHLYRVASMTISLRNLNPVIQRL